MKLHRWRESGVSLIEAMVALAVMAFGTLALIGVQATLRQNADIAKQRAEAVRIAQQRVEQWRGVTSLDPVAGVDYADIVDTGPTTIAGLNATFSRTETVQTSADPRIKTLTVDVTWTDRTNQAQQVRISSSIGGVAPQLAGSLSLPMDAALTRNPRGRHPAIPLGATDVGSGKSEFRPPGAGSLSWIFSNVTGRIVSLCSSPGVCVDTNARLLSGFVRFAVDPVAPTPADAERPPSPAFGVSVFVRQSSPVAADKSCYTQLTASYVAYYCAVPVSTAVPHWTGTSLLGGLPLASAIADPDASAFRVCRYTPHPLRDNALTVPADMSNAQHPYVYVKVAGSLQNQNFLVIRAGDGTTPFGCPDDDFSTPAIDSATWHHQPPS